MKNAWMKPASLAIAGAGLLLGAAPDVRAADLGGNCCADLEERVAELEATTVRKGNRKVSLTISGWVNEAVFFWDDGRESNVYVATNSLEQSRFKFAGEAKISDGWSAGYVIEIGIWGSAYKGVDADTPNGADNGVTNGLLTRKANWFLKSKDLGKVSVGLDGTATYHLLDDANFTVTRNYADAEAAAVALGSFKEINTGKKWTDMMAGFNGATPGQSGRRNVVRYDTPTIAGFVATAAWGEDDMWDVALSYKGDVGDFKLAARIGYGETNDVAVHKGSSKTNGGQCDVTLDKCEWWGAAGTIQHAPTGIYVYAAYGENEIDVAPGQNGNSDMWLVQAGIESKLVSIGKTTFFGEYRHDDVGLSKAAQSSDLDFWAAGVVQSIDAAAMDMYVIYREAGGDATDVSGSPAGQIALEDFKVLMTGARIQF